MPFSPKISEPKALASVGSPEPPPPSILPPERVPAAWHGHAAPYPRDEGLDVLFQRQVALQPDAIALRAGSQAMTYRELDRAANRLARTLRARGAQDEAVVGVLMGQGIDHVVAQLAIIKAGASYLPLDPEAPDPRLRYILEDSSTCLVVTDETSDHRLADGPWARLCLGGDQAQADGPGEPFAAAPAAAEQRTHILYTSGSTGKPKGVEILARGVSRLVLGADYIEFEPSDRVAQVASFGFDAAIFEVWGALLNGATVVLLPKASILDPQALHSALVEQGITVLLLTTALFNFAAESCPHAFGSLRYLLVGGERADARKLEATFAAPPDHLLNVYGPTEGTTFTTTHRVTLQDTREGTIPIGRPIANTLVYILNGDGKPVAVGEAGELCVAGDGLARGYLRKPELTRERFIELRDLVPGETTRLYRTGDQARFRSDGTMEFLGRSDFQVKIRGYRIELEEVEASLCAEPQVATAAVAVHESRVGDRSLFAHVVPHDRDTFDLGELGRALRARLPSYMVPARFRVVDALPLNVNGKIDRRAIAEATQEAMNRVMDEIPLSVRRSTRDLLESVVMGIFCDLLEIECPPLDSDFFALGGTSLLAARLVLRLREALGVNLPVYTLYKAGSLRGIIAAVRAAKRGDAPAAADDSAPWIDDAQLPLELIEQIKAAPAPSPPGRLDNLFLTGATGFLGAFLLRDLLTRTKARVTCLVRAPSNEEATARLHKSVEKYGLALPDLGQRVRALAGDLKQPRFALTAGAYEALAAEVDVILHNAAQVNYVQPYATHKASNVDGALEVLRLAIHGRRRPLHYVSTIAVFGPAAYFSKRTFIGEDEGLDPHIEGLRFDIGYSQSKWVAEKLYEEARRFGALISVYRPGFILGDSSSGAGNVDDFMARLVKGCIQIGAFPDLPGQRKEFVPVDYVSRALVEIASRPELSPASYHLVPPRPEESTSLNDFFEMLRGFGYPLEKLAYGAWIDRLLNHDQLDANALYSLVPMLAEKVYRSAATRWELYENMPVYGASRTVEALGGADFFHRMDAPLLAKYLDYFVRTGFLSPAAEAPRG